MSFNTLIYDDCCLLTDINLNPQRVYYILQRRFKSNSTRTSFDFKCFLPEQPSNNAKVSRSLLRCQPKNIYINPYEDNASSDVASSISDNDQNEVFSTDDDDDGGGGEDDRLRKLSEWEPEKFQPINDISNDEDDDDDDENNNIFQSISKVDNAKDSSEVSPMNVASVEQTPTNATEDLLVTYSHQPIKTEPISDDDDDDVFDNLPQLDGLVDIAPSKSDPTREKNLDDTIAKIVANRSTPNKTIQIHQLPPKTTTFRLNDNVKRKSMNQTSRQSTSKVYQPKEKPEKQPKPMKKVKSRLLSSVLKTNEDVIRPLQISIPTNNQKLDRLSSDSRSLALHSKLPVQRKSSSSDDWLTPPQRRTSSVPNKQKSLPQNPKTLVKSKEKSASHHMAIAAKKLKHQQSKPTSSDTCSTSVSTTSKLKQDTKNRSKIPKSKDSDARKVQSILKTVPSNGQVVQKKIKKLKRLSNQQSIDQLLKKSQKSIKDVSKIIRSSSATEKPPLIVQRSEPSITPTNSDHTNNKRPADYFADCIAIDDDEEINPITTINDDDDDIQEIERQHYSIAYTIRSREKLLDHIVHSSAMHVKWLFNLDHVLLEHISICHENNIRPLNDRFLPIKIESPSSSSIYPIDPSFISTIIINFLKLFLLQNSSNDQQNVSFIQFGLTSHLRYLLIELPTSQHSEEKDFSDHCSKCHQYSLIINILFDLLFDLLEHDLCEMASKTKYRSSLIEDDYFTRFSQTKITRREPFYRIKFLIYFIELIGIHLHQCSNRNRFQFNRNENKLFHSIEDFIRHILTRIHNSMNQRISLCFNVMELCLLFVNDKEIRIKQMALFLAELCETNPNYFQLFLLEKNLFPDIRLLFINELISRKLNIKLNSIDQIQQFFYRIHENFTSTNSIDEFVLVLLRSLFSTYADLLFELKGYSLAYSSFIRELSLLLHNQLQFIFERLIELSYKDPEYFQKLKSTLFFYRLLKCKWNQL